MLLSAYRRLIRRRPARRAYPKKYRPALESLERREVPSTFTVTGLADRGMGSGLRGDLRYAINTANANADLSNRIVFAPGLAGTITLTQGPLAVTNNLKIDGPGEDLLTISGDHRGGVLNVTADPRVQVVTLSGLTIADGTGVTVNGQNVGGGIYNDHARLTLSHCTVAGNAVAVAGFGGGIDSLGPLNLNASAVSGNTGGSGAGISAGPGMVTITSSQITGNQAGPGANGGGLALGGPATITNSTISGNTAGGQGGGVFINVALQTTTVVSFSRSTITGNRGGAGGGVMNLDGTVTVADSTISGNATATFRTAGGLDNALSAGRMTITDSFIAGNVGSGVVNGGEMTVSGSTIAGNTSPFEGGGLEAGYGDTTVVNSTISGNTSATFGGGVSLFGTASVQLTSVTITGNTANGVAGSQHGGGGLASFPSVTQGGRAILRNTLIAGNITASLGPDVIGTVISLGFNLIGQRDDSLGWSALDQTGDFFAPLDPLLGPLQDNGGPTPTHALLAGSPAIEKGDPTLFGSVDQRGTVRFHNGFNAPVDVGAFDAADRRGFRLTAPADVVAGEPFAVTLTVLDPAGNTASTFTGTVHFSSTDFDADLPDDYTFAPADAGVATFTVTLRGVGSQQLQVNDTTVPGIRTAVTVNVAAPPAVRSLAADLADLYFGAAGGIGPDRPWHLPGWKSAHGHGIVL